MNNKNNNYESKLHLLEQYIDGNLSGKEIGLVERLLTENRSLNTHYHDMLAAVDIVKYGAIQAQVSEAAENFFSGRVKAEEKTLSAVDGLVVPFRRIGLYGLRAAAVLLILVSGYGIFLYQSASPEKLYATAFQGYELQVTRSNNPDDDISAAYQNRQWQVVMEKVEAAGRVTERNLFLAGVSAMELSQFEKAISYFQQVFVVNNINSTTSYRDEAEFYLFLSYLTSGNIMKAEEMFRSINANIDHTYYKEMHSIGLTKIKLMKLH